VIVDLNCDLGEGQGDDEAILPFITSASVACGLHAGGPTVMRRTVEEAVRRGVAVGAHPGFADRDRFGRVEIDLPPGEIHDLVLYQIGALAAFATRAGTSLQHVKPHGALYHMAARRRDIAEAVVGAARHFDDALIIIGAPDSELGEAARSLGLRFAAEGFADRTYGEDGGLVPRGDPRALVDGDALAVAARAVALVRDQRNPGNGQPLVAHTLCLHGDDRRAAARAHAIRDALVQAGVQVAALGSWLQ
jgi:5-oxoprolinase (ATP-hydrolysing) subunit A